MASQPEKPEALKYDRANTAKLLLARIKEQRNQVILWLIVIAGAAAVDLWLISVVKTFTDNVISQTGSEILAGAKSIILLIVIIMLTQGIFKGAEFFLTQLNGQRLIMRLRQEIFNHLQLLGLDFFESQRTGEIMSWVTTDVQRIREFAGKQLPTLLKSPLLVIGSLAYMIYTSWQLTLTALIVIPPLVLIVNYTSKLTRTAATSVQETLAEVSGEIQEAISAIQVVKSFANEDYEIGKFREVNMHAYRAELRRARIEAILAPSLNLIASIGLGILIFIGAVLLARPESVLNGSLGWFVPGPGEFTAGDFALVILLLHKTYTEANKLGRTYMAFQDTLAASDRIFAFMEIESTIIEKPGAIEIESCEGHVELANVSFNYPTRDGVLKNINIDARPGSTIALVGPSGGGKSSIVRLIPRFYDVAQGKVLIDGRNVRDLTLKSLRNLMAIVPQETVMFHGTVRENIAYGKLDATDEEIKQAAVAANAHEFITQLEDGYDTIVGERGVKLSGGQRQRISIARAILRDPRILILDEATSNLDTESEKIVQAALEKLMVGRTTFVIAHRLTTIRNAGEIIVLKAGEITDRGTHEELIGRAGLYRELYEVEEQSGS